MKHMQDLSDFLLPVNVSQLNEDVAYNDGQLGNHILIHENDIPDISKADVIIVGIGEMRGSGLLSNENHSIDKIRKQLYRLHFWHTDVVIADLGNIKTGASVNDSYAALKTVTAEVMNLGKTILIIGGSHDITMAQYETYKGLNQIIEATCIDAMIDLKGDSNLRSENFLLDMLTSEPNMVRHYNHIAFQSYFVHPRLLETMDKLRFDCFRVGAVKEDIEEMEPVIRNSNLVSFDISALKHSAAPANAVSPNGLDGEDACTLAQYAGLSSSVNSFGIYGYTADTDVHELTAKQIAQMIWYFIDGKNKSKREASFDDKNNFVEYHTVFSELDTIFLQSKRTNRWWMQMPNEKFIACSRKDYLTAKMNDIPERWLRAQERAV
jgi:arginase family enzyme